MIVSLLQRHITESIAIIKDEFLPELYKTSLL